MRCELWIFVIFVCAPTNIKPKITTNKKRKKRSNQNRLSICRHRSNKRSNTYTYTIVSGFIRIKFFNTSEHLQIHSLNATTTNNNREKHKKKNPNPTHKNASTHKYWSHMADCVQTIAKMRMLMCDMRMSVRFYRK